MTASRISFPQSIFTDLCHWHSPCGLLRDATFSLLLQGMLSVGAEGEPIPSTRHHDIHGCTEMLCEITLGPSYLKADLFNRQTADEARDALAAIAAEARKHACSQILISVHASRPLFKVEQYGLPDYFKGFGEMSKYRIALTGDSDELRLSQQYIELLARRNGVNVRSFPSEQAALSWLRDRRWSPERRQRGEPWAGQERRRHPPRRNHLASRA
jgi:hypothetical protein